MLSFMTADETLGSSKPGLKNNFQNISPKTNILEK